MVSGGGSRTYAEGETSLVKYNLVNGKMEEVILFVPGSCDPHGLAVLNGQLISCDSGDHPGWNKPYTKPGWGKRSSPSAGAIFSIHLSDSYAYQA